jgi:hypothetical protein
MPRRIQDTVKTRNLHVKVMLDPTLLAVVSLGLSRLPDRKKSATLTFLRVFGDESVDILHCMLKETQTSQKVNN